jgi:hypothetical protein
LPHKTAPNPELPPLFSPLRERIFPEKQTKFAYSIVDFEDASLSTIEVPVQLLTSRNLAVNSTEIKNAALHSATNVDVVLMFVNVGANPKSDMPSLRQLSASVLLPDVRPPQYNVFTNVIVDVAELDGTVKDRN